MINAIKRILEDELNAIEIKKSWSSLNNVYATPQGIYGLVEFANIEKMENEWENCAAELATRVQAQLQNGIDNLRWDIYLIMLVDNNIPTLLRKVIENDRRYFKKIVINSRELDLNRLPFIFDFNITSIGAELLIQQESMFLKSLRNTLSDKSKKVFGEEFFDNGQNYSSVDIYNLLNQTKEAENQ
ncbi:ABC-three component system middle component 1 [Terribacillus sp. DMT04]|uniref:ABC-three component system middle component 1 n=1 Tax=Terribacillus sp. DMT04 TaxID=2850441 RepID=UPI00352C9D7A